MGKLFSIKEFEEAEKTPEQTEELINYLKNYIDEHKEEIKKYFAENYNRSKIYMYETKVKNSKIEITKKKHKPEDYSIKMVFDDDEKLPLHLELYNIGGLLSKNGILYRIIMFYSFCCTIQIEEEMDENEKRIRINQCLKAIDNDDITFLESISQLKMYKVLFNLIKSGYKIIKSWFPGANESIVDTILGRIKSYLLRGLSAFLLTNIRVVSGLVLLTLGIIVFIPTVIYAKYSQKKINEYIRKKNRINLGIIIEQIRTIFMREEEVKVLDFFRNNDIYALAYDVNKNSYKNAGAAFFAHYIGGMGQKARQLKRDSETGFDTENDLDESLIYDCYEKNILEIMNFFKDTRVNFKRILILPKHENLKENKDFKAILDKLIQFNEKAIKENNDIITTTNLVDDSISQPLLDNSLEKDTIIIVPKIIEDDNKNKEIEKLKNIINDLNNKLEQDQKYIRDLANLNLNRNNQINALQIFITDLQNRLNHGYNEYEAIKKDYDNLKEGYENFKNFNKNDQETSNNTNKNLEQSKIIP